MDTDTNRGKARLDAYDRLHELVIAFGFQKTVFNLCSIRGEPFFHCMNSTKKRLLIRKIGVASGDKSELLGKWNGPLSIH